MATFPSAAGNEIVHVRALPSDLVDDLQRVQKAAQRITSILDLDQLIDSVVNEVAESFGCVEAGVYLHDEDRVVLRYLDNPNGSVDDIAGITNASGNVVGLMPHPERASHPLLGSEDGALLLRSLLQAAEASAAA